MADQSEYVDYDLYLDAKFSPIAFANTLVQATNNPTDQDVDLDAPAKRLQYDLDEVDKLVKAIAGDNYTELLEQAGTTQLAREALSELQSGIKNVNYSYGKLSNDVLVPYEKAQTVYAALKRLHTTSSLLRSLTWYLYLSRRLDSGSSDAPSSEAKDHVYRVAFGVKQCRAQLESYPALKTLQIITSHERVLTQKQQHARDQATSIVRSLGSRTDRTRLSYALSALHVMGANLLTTAVAETIPRKVRESSDQLTKSLMQLPHGFIAAAQDTKDRARCLVMLTNVLETTKVEDTHETLLNVVKRERPDLDFEHVLPTFWRDVATDFDSRLRDYLKRNEPAARGRKRLIPELKQAIADAVIQSGVSANGPAVRVMTNCLNAWERL